MGRIEKFLLNLQNWEKFWELGVGNEELGVRNLVNLELGMGVGGDRNGS